jgi:hypothetical protein
VKYATVSSVTANTGAAAGAVVTLSADPGHTFSTASYLCTGPVIDRLAARERHRLSAPASSGQPVIEIADAFTALAGGDKVRVWGVDPADQISVNSETPTVSSSTSSSVTFTTNLTENYDSVTGIAEKDEDPTSFTSAHSFEPVWTRLEPETAASDGAQLSLIQAFPMRIR